MKEAAELPPFELGYARTALRSEHTITDETLIVCEHFRLVESLP